MPWEHKTVREQRQEFVLAAQECSNFSALCRTFGISRKSGYKWVQCAAAGEVLDDRSRRPGRVSNRTSEEVEGKILALRAQQPGWGARKLKVVLERSGEADIPGERTVCRILRRHGCIDQRNRASASHTSALSANTATNSGRPTSRASSEPSMASTASRWTSLTTTAALCCASPLPTRRFKSSYRCLNPPSANTGCRKPSSRTTARFHRRCLV